MRTQKLVGAVKLMLCSLHANEVGLASIVCQKPDQDQRGLCLILPVGEVAGVLAEWRLHHNVCGLVARFFVSHPV